MLSAGIPNTQAVPSPKPGVHFRAALSCLDSASTENAVFSVIWTVVVQPYPYANADRMAHLALGDLAASGRYNSFAITVPQWQQLRSLPAVEDSILTRFANLTVTGEDLPEDVYATYMTSNGFPFFAVPAALGRGSCWEFWCSECRPSSPAWSRSAAPLASSHWKRCGTSSR